MLIMIEFVLLNRYLIYPRVVIVHSSVNHTVVQPNQQLYLCMILKEVGFIPCRA